VHFLTVKDGGKCVVTLIYDKPLPEAWPAAARALVAALGDGISVQGRSKGKCLIEGCEYVTERLSLPEIEGVCRGWGGHVMYQQVEGSFSNPNPAVNEKVLGWLCQCVDLVCAWERCHEHEATGDAQTCARTDPLPCDVRRDPFTGNAAAAAHPSLKSSRPRAGEVLLELYSGNGNHTCVLARKFRRVVAVEINPVLCEAAEANLRLNGVTNVVVYCSPSASFCRHVVQAKRLPVRRSGGDGQCGKVRGEEEEEGGCSGDRERTAEETVEFDSGESLALHASRSSFTRVGGYGVRDRGRGQGAGGKG
jgi:tRNA/tmRNA/rRNA uracil-C5-methylase (TrmA/RlmC/RlmD family)